MINVEPAPAAPSFWMLLRRKCTRFYVNSRSLALQNHRLFELRFLVVFTTKLSNQTKVESPPSNLSL